MKTFILSTVMLVLAGCGENLTHPLPGSPAGEGGAGGAGQLSCVPNLDGKIEAAEFKAVLNTPVDYLVGNNRTVDLHGKVDPEGHQVWDFSTDVSSDGVITVQATGLADRWYQSSFPGGQWVAPADALGTTDGVYAADAQAIYLLGLASAKEAPPEQKTLLVYDQPVAVYRFPLVKGASWKSVGTFTNATAAGIYPVGGTHTYDIRDDLTGQLELTSFTLSQAHRIRTTLTITLTADPDHPIVKRQTGFVFECFGEVVRASSAPGEMNDDFTKAAELRRLKN
jgi:hypothetical protein